MIRMMSERAHHLVAAGEAATGAGGDGGELEGEAWRLVGWLMGSALVMETLCDMARGDEALSLLFDVAASDSRGLRRARRLRWAAAQSLEGILRRPSETSLEAYIAAYGCLGKLAIKLGGARGQGGWTCGEVVHAAKVAVGLVVHLSREGASGGRPMEEWVGGGGMAALEGVAVWAYVEEDGEAMKGVIECLAMLVYAAPSPHASPQMPPQAGGTPFQQSSSVAGWLDGGLRGVSALQGANQRAFDGLLDVLERAAAAGHEGLVSECVCAIGVMYAGNPETYARVRSGANRGVAGVVEKGDVGLEDALRVTKDLALGGVGGGEELRAVGRLLECGGAAGRRAACVCLREVVNGDGGYKDQLRALGLVDVLIECIQTELDECEAEAEEGELPVVECLTMLVKGSQENAGAVSSSRGVKDLFEMVRSPVKGPSALALLTEIARSGLEGDAEMCVTSLCEVIAGQRAGSGGDWQDWRVAVNASAALVCIVEGRGGVTRAVFRKSGGFDAVVALLSALSGSLADAKVSQEVTWANGAADVQESTPPGGGKASGVATPGEEHGSSSFNNSLESSFGALLSDGTTTPQRTVLAYELHNLTMGETGFETSRFPARPQMT